AGGARKWPGVQLALALGGPRPGRRRRPRPARVARHRGARIRGLRGPGRPRAGFPCPRRARAHNPAPALLQGADAISDRAAGRDLADARLAADPPLAREDPRGDRGGRRGGTAPAVSRVTLGTQAEDYPVAGLEPPRSHRVSSDAAGRRAPPRIDTD